MGIEENKKIERKFIDEFNKGNFDAIYEIEHPDSVFHVSPEVEVKGDTEGFKQVIAALKSSFPDLNISPEDMIAEGNMLVTRYTMTGTHTGADYMGIAATGNKFEFEGVMIQRFRDGKVVERWEYLDRLEMLRQRGVIPSLDKIINIQKQKQTEEKNKANIRQQIEECWNKGDFSSVHELVSPDFIYHTPKKDLHGTDGFKDWVNTWRTGFPDFHMTVEKMIAEEECVVVQLTWEGTFTGIFDGNQPTGNKVKMDELWLYRFQDGKDVGPLPYGNMLSLIQQMGINPTN